MTLQCSYDCLQRPLPVKAGMAACDCLARPQSGGGCVWVGGVGETECRTATHMCAYRPSVAILLCLHAARWCALHSLATDLRPVGGQHRAVGLHKALVHGTPGVL